MKKLRELLILGLLVIISLIGVIGCNSAEKSERVLDLKQFENEMKSKRYQYKRQDLQEGLLTPISQYMLLNKSTIIDGKQVTLYDTDVIIYSYEDNEEMEKEASTINKDASEINRTDNPIQIEWSKTPHFYKKGKIIVQYIGDDEKIISDLKEIVGDQFAGR
ncbi:hypothetical protein QOZ84_02180 [Romboutsia sedimentorum]|uniref:DUF4367 domain-containing protein n=1 Tax=Romboutsia sedimentorum TaxID=1368474 RepID=A0ABT7E8M6_9FIRM|nr:hypothetical protein [Romboutsia sedimentorum]MDK2562341.1 hypothetical protein [Romboutsia sedimentorum]MDK2584582.1 hypothetical protein [Romboutsia sedimentorum]